MSPGNWKWEMSWIVCVLELLTHALDQCRLWLSLPLFSFPHLACNTERLTQLTSHVSIAPFREPHKTASCLPAVKAKPTIPKVDAHNMVM